MVCCICVRSHLHRATVGSDCKWKYSHIEDIQEVEIKQIVNCNVEGHWDITQDKRKRLFKVKNIYEINLTFQNTSISEKFLSFYHCQLTVIRLKSQILLPEIFSIMYLNSISEDP